jgi:hypothetical protein
MYANSESDRVPGVYLTSAFSWFFSVLCFRRINKLRCISLPEGFDPHPGHLNYSGSSFLRGATALWKCDLLRLLPSTFHQGLHL